MRTCMPEVRARNMVHLEPRSCTDLGKHLQLLFVELVMTFFPMLPSPESKLLQIESPVFVIIPFPQ